MKNLILKTFNIKSERFVIRNLKKDDVKDLLRYINTLSKEETYILLQGKEVSLKEEKEYLDKLLKDVKDKKAVQLAVYYKDKLVGLSDIKLKDNACKHEGVFGISLVKKYRGIGIGKRLMNTVLDEAQNLPDLKIITLGVFENNKIAKKIYEDFGFKEFGRLPKGILHRGKYRDHIYMYKNI